MSFDHSAAAVPGAGDNTGFRDIGRPLDPEWYENFKGHLAELVVKDGLDCRYPALPGVVLATSHDLQGVATNFGPYEDLPGTQAVVEQLINRNVIDGELARSGLKLTLLSVSRDRQPRRVNNSLRIRAVFGDKPCAAYNGYVMSGERRAIEDALGIVKNRPLNPKARPENFVTLASLINPGDSMYAFMGVLHKSLGRRKPLKLGPVGIVSSFPEPASQE